MKNIIILVVVISFTGMSQVTLAGDASKGREKAEIICQKCHGPEGVSRDNPLWPNLKSQQAPYIIKQLKAFRSGERKDPAMNAIAAGLSDADMENLATYYNGLK